MSGSDRAALRVGVVGTRGHAERVAVPTVQANAAMTLAAVIGSDPSRTRAAAERWRTDAAAVGDPVEGLDAVWITAPNHVHHELAEHYLRAGLHVLLEKPLAIGPEQAARVTAAAAEARGVLRVAYQHRFRPAHQLLRRLISDGGLGDIVSLRVHRYWRFPYFPGQQLSEWRRSDDTSGGWVLNDVGSHLIDLVEWLLPDDELDVASAVLGAQVPDVAADSSCALTLVAGDRTVVQIDCANSAESPGSLVDVYGTRGWVRVTGSFDEHATLTAYGSDTAHRFDTPAAVPYAAMADDFVAATRGRQGDGATAAQAEESVRIIDELRRTARLIGVEAP